jgi:GntR family transcriptional regulator of arabinose operon
MSMLVKEKLRSIHTELRQKIVSGEWKVGHRLSTTTELAKTFQCSIGMVSKALSTLAHEGLIEQRPRLGTRVLGSSASTGSASMKLDAFAFIHPTKRHEGIWRLAKGFQDAASEKGRQVFMLTSEADFRREIEFVTRLSEFAVLGAVVYPSLLTPQNQVQFSKVLLDAKLPIVLAEVGLLGLERPSVILDGFHAGYTMTRHLIERGAKNIGFLANYARIPSVRDRYLGYRTAIEESGAKVKPERVLLELDVHPNFDDPLLESRELVRKYLKSCGKIDGVVCVDDFIATGMLQVAKEQGLRVPGDLKITGAEDFTLPNPEDVALTTYHVPFEQMGWEAFNLLESIITEKSNSCPEIQVRGKIVIREST